MKILALFEKLFNPYVLIAFNILLILATQFVGGGTFFAETGLVHAVSLIFVGLIVVRIFSEYAFSDYILRGFLRIQLTFFLFLGFVHVYEYFGLHFFMLDHEAIELSAMLSYFVWIVGVLLALEFVFRIYYKKSTKFMAVLYALLAAGTVGLIGLNVSHEIVEEMEKWIPVATFVGILGFGTLAIVYTRKIRTIMPVFKEYSYYAIPAIVLMALTALSEYFESTHYLLDVFGISDIQNLYLAHYSMYAAFSLLLIGFGKLKKPKGIYEEM